MIRGSLNLSLVELQRASGLTEVFRAVTRISGLDLGNNAENKLALNINSPVLFIADDIMESFDDDRTAEAFGLLAEMRKIGHVIYQTHHAHLCDIAKNSCPSVCIHELQG